MKFQGAVIKEQNVKFAVVIVQKHVVDNRMSANSAVQSFQPIFPGLNIVLMAQNSQGTPTYYGRPDIANFMARVPIHAVPWKEYTVS